MVSQNTTAIADVEIYDQSGQKIYQRYWENQAFAANRARTFTTVWTVPNGTPPGKYTVMVGTFRPGWKDVYSFNRQAATLTVT